MRLFRNKRAPDAEWTTMTMAAPLPPPRTAGDLITRWREIHTSHEHAGTFEDCGPCLAYIL